MSRVPGDASNLAFSTKMCQFRRFFMKISIQSFFLFVLYIPGMFLEK